VSHRVLLGVLAMAALAGAPLEAGAPVEQQGPRFPRFHRVQERVSAFMDRIDPHISNPVGVPEMRPGSLAWRLKRRLGLYMGVGVRVPFRMKANWYFKRYGVARALVGVPLLVLGLPAVAGFVIPPPANSVWAGGLPREWVTVKAKIKTATSLKSGLFVIRDTTNDEIQVAGNEATTVAGILSERNWSLPDWDGGNTGLAAGQIVDVIMHIPGTIVKCRNASNLTYGALLNTAAAGIIKAAAVAAAGDIPKVVGKLLQDNDGSGAETANALVVLGF
jgi:hypothetical protein